MAVFESFDDIISFFRFVLDTFNIDVGDTSLCLKALSLCSFLTLMLHVIKVWEEASSPHVSFSRDSHPPSRKRKRESSVGKRTKVRRKTEDSSSSSPIVTVTRVYPTRSTVADFEKVIGEDQQDSVTDVFNKVVGDDLQDSVTDEECSDRASNLLNTGFCAEEEREQDIEDVNEIIKNDLNN